MFGKTVTAPHVHSSSGVKAPEPPRPPYQSRAGGTMKCLSGWSARARGVGRPAEGSIAPPTAFSALMHPSTQPPYVDGPTQPSVTKSHSHPADPQKKCNRHGGIGLECGTRSRLAAAGGKAIKHKQPSKTTGPMEAGAGRRNSGNFTKRLGKRLNVMSALGAPPRASHRLPPSKPLGDPPGTFRLCHSRRR